MPIADYYNNGGLGHQPTLDMTAQPALTGGGGGMWPYVIMSLAQGLMQVMNRPKPQPSYPAAASVGQAPQFRGVPQNLMSGLRRGLAPMGGANMQGLLGRR